MLQVLHEFAKGAGLETRNDVGRKVRLQIRLVIIIPASNEEAYIHACLESVAGQRGDGAFLTIVSANACTDGTLERARSCSDLFSRKEHELVILSSSTPGKVPALNRAEDAIPPELTALPRQAPR